MPRTDRYGIRTSVEGKDATKADFEEIGTSGAASLERLDAGTGKVSAGFGTLDKSTRGTRDTLRLFGNQVALLDGPLGGIASRITAVGSSIGRFGLIATGATAAITAFGFATAAALRVFADSEQVIFRLGGVLRATGNAVGLTKDEIDDLAVSLGDLTLTSADEAREAAASLLTFRTVQGDTFERTLRLSQDLAAVFGTTLPNAALQLGKALEDPITGLTALRRSGVNFTEEQKELLRTLAETGQVLQAQTIILDRVEEQVGGAGVAEAGGLTGATDTLGESWDRLLKRFAQTTGSVDIAVSGINALTASIEAITAPTETQGRIEELESFLETATDPTTRATGERNLERLRRIRAIELETESLEKLAAVQGQSAAIEQQAADAESTRATGIQEIVANLEFELDQLQRSGAEQRVQAILRDDAARATEAEADNIRDLVVEIERVTEAEKAREAAKKETDKEEEKRLAALASRGPRALRELVQEVNQLETAEQRQSETFGDLLE
ncbi:MAG: phage tail length tape measure family protein, partial [Geminicoccaceae bacterium]